MPQPPPSLRAELRLLRLVARIALGLVAFYWGLRVGVHVAVACALVSQALPLLPRAVRRATGGEK